MEMLAVMLVQIVNIVCIVIKTEAIVVFALPALCNLIQKCLLQQRETFRVLVTLQALSVKALQKKD